MPRLWLGPDLLRAGATVVEVKGSHTVYVSQPQAVAHIIGAAAKGALVAEKEKGGTSRRQTGL
jgi:hypothetical protein